MKKSKEEIEFEQWSTESYCLEAVKRNADSLRYVKERVVFMKIISERKKGR